MTKSPKWQIVDQWQRLGSGFGAEIFCRPQIEKIGDSLWPLCQYFFKCKSSGDETNLKVGAPVQRKVPVVPLHFFGSKNTISRFGERFRDGQYSLVSFLFAVLLLKVPSCAICKFVGGLWDIKCLHFYIDKTAKKCWLNWTIFCKNRSRRDNVSSEDVHPCKKSTAPPALQQ